MHPDRHNSIKGELLAPKDEEKSIMFQLPLLEEAGVHELVPQLRNSIVQLAPNSQVSVEVQARVRNPVILSNRFNLSESERIDLALVESPDIIFLPFGNDLNETSVVRTHEIPFLRVNFYYDIGLVKEFEKKRRRDEVSTVATSYQAIVIETSPSRAIRVYHYAYLRRVEAFNGSRTEVDEYTVDNKNAFVLPYYTQTKRDSKHELQRYLPEVGGWSSQDSGDIGIKDRIPLVSSLKVPNAALYLLSIHPPRHTGK